MPFPLVYRVPKSIKNKILKALRIELVRITSELMGCPKEWVSPDFFRSALKDPATSDEGSSTVLVKLETSIFHGRTNDDQEIQKVLKALVDAVFEAFGGQYAVEIGVVDWHPDWKYLRKVLYCQMPECNGTLKVETFSMQTGCHSTSPCRACTTCGRVHSDTGGFMFSRAGESIFLRKRKIKKVFEPVEFTPGEKYKTTSWLWLGLDEEQLEAGTELVFVRMDDEIFCFHGPNKVEYRLYRGNVTFIEPVLTAD